MKTLNQLGDTIYLMDLGFLLLMSFLLVADIATEQQVTLPGGQEMATEMASVYRLRFNRPLETVLEDLKDHTIYCQPHGLETLRACLADLRQRFVARGRRAPRIVLHPEDGAVVQQLVDLLDLCRHEALSCTIES